LFNSFLTFIFGLAYSDVYGFKDIFDGLILYWSQIIEYIHNSKFYKILIKEFKLQILETIDQILEILHK
jgi:hypothetical protein